MKQCNNCVFGSDVMVPRVINGYRNDRVKQKAIAVKKLNIDRHFRTMPVVNRCAFWYKSDGVQLNAIIIALIILGK